MSRRISESRSAARGCGARRERGLAVYVLAEATGARVEHCGTMRATVSPRAASSNDACLASITTLIRAIPLALGFHRR